MFKGLKKDIRAFLDHDPAARNGFEVLFLYPGMRALVYHRWAHWLFNHKMKFLARWTSEHAHRVTGIDIHPGAKIARGICIDHGTGVVIGETAEIGEGCVIYQGATLGGTGTEKGKRHPTLGCNVMVGAGAKILGPFTVGDNSRIAANSVVLEEVPANSTAVGAPAKIVRREGKRIEPILDHIHIPDPVMQKICALEHRIDKLENEEENKQ